MLTGSCLGPHTIEFLRLAKARRFHLADTVDTIAELLDVIDAATTHLSLEATSHTRLIEFDYLGEPLQRFYQLQHLDLGGGILPRPADDFFTTLLARSTLTSLTLGMGVQLHADKLREALEDTALAVGLKKIALDNIKVDQGEWESDEPAWTSTCSFEQAKKLVLAIRSRGIQVGGSIEDAIQRQIDLDKYLESEEKDFEGISTCAFYSDRYAL